VNFFYKEVCHSKSDPGSVVQQNKFSAIALDSSDDSLFFYNGAEQGRIHNLMSLYFSSETLLLFFFTSM
jgi:hypothetical protein